MRIAMNDFAKEYASHNKKLLRRLDAFFSEGNYILGPNVLAFENEFARHMGSRYGIGVANGLEALQIALLGLGIGKGDEVITVSNTDAATVLAIIFTGATPVFIDIDEYYHMDPGQLAKAVTNRTKAIIPVHLFGQTADMKGVLTVAKNHNLFLIEDACQAHGARYHGKKAGTFGDAGCFSFYPTKNLGAIGDAGAIITKRKFLYTRSMLLRNRGSLKRAIHILPGLNSRLDELQAVILRDKLPRLEAMNEKRRTIARWYGEMLAGLPEVELPKERSGAKHVYHLYVIRVRQREKLQRYLLRHGATTLIHYPLPLHQQKPFRRYSRHPLPVTERYAKEILSLPIHPYMTKTEIIYISKLICRFYKK
ncbi:MAG: DegT/DnrJ/EryC1/StrS family aminotransferase [Patescibacteria group bacterium]